MNPAATKDSSDDEERLLARLAVKGDFVSAEKMAELLSLQREERSHGRAAPLEEILLKSQLVTQKQLDSLRSAGIFLLKREQERVFCRILLKAGYANQEQIDLALLDQQRLFKTKQEVKSVMEILLEKGTITARKRDAVLAAAEKLRKDRPQDAPAVHREAGEADSAEKKAPPQPTAETWECGEVSERISGDPGATIIEGEFFNVIVSGDRLQAHVALKGDLPNGMDAGGIRALLEARGMHGLADEDDIEQCLRGGDVTRRVFKVAQGTPPKDGTSATIRYHFRARPKWEELIQARARLDFKNRGEIPQVHQGDLLAEKVPMVQEEPGLDVYGKPFSVTKARDAKLLAGMGVELSPDGLKVHAMTDGRPEVCPFGKISVYQELNINGDVDFETGNVEFNGHIIVNGVVQDGFRVKGGSLTAKEISKASVDVSGEVVVYGGVLAADIKAQGGVRAFHFHASRIESLGDVVVEKGIVDSRVVTTGKCVATHATILASTISAKMGIEAAQIGSYRSGPCTVIFGVDHVAQKEIALRRADISRLEKERADVAVEVRKMRDQYEKIERTSGELVQVQDRSIMEQRALSEELQKWNEAGNQDAASTAQNALDELAAAMKSRDAELDTLLDQQDAMRESIAACQAKMREITKAVQGMKEEIAAFAAWSQDLPERPCIKVSGLITAGTVLKGPNTSAILRNDVKAVLVKEVIVSPEESSSASGFKMKITALS